MHNLLLFIFGISLEVFGLRNVRILQVMRLWVECQTFTLFDLIYLIEI